MASPERVHSRLALAVLAGRWGRLGLTRDLVVAACRAIVQLIAVSAVIGLMLQRIWTSLIFAALMFSVAVWTAGGRIRARSDWRWVAVAIDGAQPRSCDRASTATVMARISGVIVGS